MYLYDIYICAHIGPNGGGRVTWDPIITMDFLATVMDVLNVDRPDSQKNWHFDGVSIMDILRGDRPAERGMGWMYMHPYKSAKMGYAFRYGKWKYVAGGASCDPAKATFNCTKEQLYDMSTDYVENHDLAEQYPEVLAAIAANFTVWYNTIWDSSVNESQCKRQGGPQVIADFPEGPYGSSDKCSFMDGKALDGITMAQGSVDSIEQCCYVCEQTKGCVASDYIYASPMRPTFQGQMFGGTCFLYSDFIVKEYPTGEIQTAILV